MFEASHGRVPPAGWVATGSLRNMLITGWCLLVPATVMYAVIMFVETR
ncbi:hypothetical protein GTA28_29345 [Rhodococcus hoagii]|nr:hypothetical protein [Prescottella equi]